MKLNESYRRYLLMKRHPCAKCKDPAQWGWILIESNSRIQSHSASLRKSSNNNTVTADSKLLLLSYQTLHWIIHKQNFRINSGNQLERGKHNINLMKLMTTGLNFNGISGTFLYSHNSADCSIPGLSWGAFGLRPNMSNLKHCMTTQLRCLSSNRPFYFQNNTNFLTNSTDLIPALKVTTLTRVIIILTDYAFREIEWISRMIILICWAKIFKMLISYHDGISIPPFNVTFFKGLKIWRLHLKTTSCSSNEVYSSWAHTGNHIPL